MSKACFACYEDHMAELQEAVMFYPSVLSGVSCRKHARFLPDFFDDPEKADQGHKLLPVLLVVIRIRLI